MSCSLNHIHLVCRDLQVMIDFFTVHFDAKFITMKKFGGADGASLNLGGTAVYLRVPQENEKLANDVSVKTYGYHHIGINVDDVDKKFKELVDKGFAFSSPPRDANEATRVAHVVGPDNVAIELMQKKG